MSKWKLNTSKTEDIQVIFQCVCAFWCMVYLEFSLVSIWVFVCLFWLALVSHRQHFLLLKLWEKGCQWTLERLPEWKPWKIHDDVGSFAICPTVQGAGVLLLSLNCPGRDYKPLEKSCTPADWAQVCLWVQQLGLMHTCNLHLLFALF